MIGRRELVRVARLSYFVILTIAAVIMVNVDSIQEAWQLSLLFGAVVWSCGGSESGSMSGRSLRPWRCRSSLLHWS